MTYLLRHKENNRSKNYKKTLGVLFFAFILFMSFYFWSNAISTVFLKVLVPISSFFSKAESNMEVAFKLFEPELSLISENESLKKRVSELESREFDRRFTEAENSLLREELGLLEEDYGFAYILLMPPQTPYDSILIDKGESEGVFVGSKVLTSEKAVLGYVEEVMKDNSRVKMFSSGGIKTSAVSERDGTLVELEGKGGGNFFLEAPLGFEIKEGDVFLLPGSEQLVVAIVGSVKHEETSSFISVLLRAPLQIHRNSPLMVELQ